MNITEANDRISQGDIEKLELAKDNFAQAFIEAVSTKSIEACKKLVLSYDEQAVLFGKENIVMSKEDYHKVLTRQCQAFFEKWEKFIDEKNASSFTKLTLNNLAKVDTYEFKVTNEPFQTMRRVSVSMKEYKKGKMIYRVGFQIDEPIFINGRFAINNMLLVRCYESFWDDLSDIPYTDKISTYKEFKELIRGYVNINLDENKFYGEWYVHKGDLKLDKFDEKVSLIVTGNLTVKEPLVEITTGLIVCGKTVVNAMYLEETNSIFLLGGVEFDVALISVLTDSYREIYHPKGPFLYNDSESAEIIGAEEVECYFNNAFGEFSCNIEETLKEKYIDRDNDEPSMGVDIDLIVEDIKLGKNIFKHKREV